eukprot:SAG11_NODE_21882_length_416_cov_3.962145_1_plen_79_part_00
MRCGRHVTEVATDAVAMWWRRVEDAQAPQTWEAGDLYFDDMLVDVEDGGSKIGWERRGTRKMLKQVVVYVSGLGTKTC